jgi:hypothetical protein
MWILLYRVIGQHGMYEFSKFLTLMCMESGLPFDDSTLFDFSDVSTVSAVRGCVRQAPALLDEVCRLRSGMSNDGSIPCWCVSVRGPLECRRALDSISWDTQNTTYV